MTGVQRPVIRTPDQRIRVFVSSTLRELADERRAARTAIERLRLAPVMFELGARPHPPRELYRAYLEQSDVFVGIYWRELRLGRPRRGGLGPRGRVQPRARGRCRSSSTSRRPTHRERRLDELHRPDPRRRHRGLPPVRDRRRAARSGSPTTSRRCSPSASTSRAAAGESDADGARLVAGRAHARRRTRATIGRERRPRRGARPARAAATTGVVTPRRPGRDRQEPARDRDRARRRRDLFPDGIVLRAARGRARAEDCCCRRSRTALGIRDNGEAALEERLAHALDGSARADRARQLRADRRCRARCSSRLFAVAPLADVPRDEPHRAADPRRARVRGRARSPHRLPTSPASLRRATPLRRGRSCSSTAPRPSSRASSSRPRMRPTSPTSAAGSRDCRWRSSSRRRGSACSPPAGILRGSTGSSRCSSSHRATSRAAADDAGDDRLVRPGCSTSATPAAHGPRRLLTRLHPRGGRGDRRSSGSGTSTCSRRSRRSSTARWSHQDDSRRRAGLLAARDRARVRRRAASPARRGGCHARRARRRLHRGRADAGGPPRHR